MRSILVLVLSLVADGGPSVTSPKSAEPEYGRGLRAAIEVRNGISLFDGQTSFGWKGAAVRDGVLSGGVTTSDFPDYDLILDAETAGEIRVGKDEAQLSVLPGSHLLKVEGHGPGPIRLGEGLRLKSLTLEPKYKIPLGDFDPRHKPTWRVIPHPTLPRERQATWEEVPNLSRIKTGVPATLHATGGPGCVEFDGEFDNFVLRVRMRVQKPLSNAGLFFRCRAGDFLNGYEAQVFNGCYDGDPARPARYATGAIDDRQNARRLVSRDSAPFTMTVIASGPHIATWVNGYQVTDWTDERHEDDNARKGLRLKAGPIQLQAHDKGTDVIFSDVRVAPLN